MMLVSQLSVDSKDAVLRRNCRQLVTSDPGLKFLIPEYIAVHDEVRTMLRKKGDNDANKIVQSWPDLSFVKYEDSKNSKRNREFGLKYSEIIHQINNSGFSLGLMNSAAHRKLIKNRNAVGQFDDIHLFVMYDVLAAEQDILFREFGHLRMLVFSMQRSLGKKDSGIRSEYETTMLADTQNGILRSAVAEMVEENGIDVDIDHLLNNFFKYPFCIIALVASYIFHKYTDYRSALLRVDVRNSHRELQKFSDPAYNMKYIDDYRYTKMIRMFERSSLVQPDTTISTNIVGQNRDVSVLGLFKTVSENLANNFSPVTDNNSLMEILLLNPNAHSLISSNIREIESGDILLNMLRMFTKMTNSFSDSKQNPIPQEAFSILMNVTEKTLRMGAFVNVNKIRYNISNLNGRPSFVQGITTQIDYSLKI